MRALLTAAKAFLALTRLPAMVLVAEFSTGVKLTNWPKNITVGGKTYTGAKGTNPFVLSVEGLSESLEFDAPSAVMKIESLDGHFVETFFEDGFRGAEVTIRLIYIDSSNEFQLTGWESTYAIDADEASHKGVILRLAPADAVLGTELPRRTTQEGGCQHKFQEGGCPFRWVQGVSTALKTCDKGFDTPNGCKIHFPDLCLEHQAPWIGNVCPGSNHTRIVQPKPFGGFIGSVDHSIVRR